MCSVIPSTVTASRSADVSTRGLAAAELATTRLAAIAAATGMDRDFPMYGPPQISTAPRLGVQRATTYSAWAGIGTFRPRTTVHRNVPRERDTARVSVTAAFRAVARARPVARVGPRATGVLWRLSWD